MSSIVTRSQDNRVPLGCDEKEESHQGCMYLLELCDVVMSVWTKVCALKIQAVKVGNKLYLKWLVWVYCNTKTNTNTTDWS